MHLGMALACGGDVLGVVHLKLGRLGSVFEGDKHETSFCFTIHRFHLKFVPAQFTEPHPPPPQSLRSCCIPTGCALGEPSLSWCRRKIPPMVHLLSENPPLWTSVARASGAPPAWPSLPCPGLPPARWRRLRGKSLRRRGAGVDPSGTWLVFKGGGGGGGELNQKPGFLRRGGGESN